MWGKVLFLSSSRDTSAAAAAEGKLLTFISATCVGTDGSGG